MKLAICDTDTLLIEHLSQLISEYIEVDYKLLIFYSFAHLINYLRVHKDIDVLFLNIHIQEDDGIECARLIREHDTDMRIIFMSDDLEYLQDIFDVHPSGFIVKPIDENKMVHSLQRIVEESRLLHRKLKFNSIEIAFDHIYYIESNLRKIHLHTKTQTLSEYGKLLDIEDQLDDVFVRAHNSYIVNLSKVKEMTKEGFVLLNGKVVPISQSHKNDVKRKYISYIINSEE